MREQGAFHYHKFSVGCLGRCNHAIPRLEGANVAAYRAYYSAHIPAEDHRQRLGKILLPCPRPNLPIDGVNAGGCGLHQHEVGAKRRLRNISLKFQVFRPTIFVQANSFQCSSIDLRMWWPCIGHGARILPSNATMPVGYEEVEAGLGGMARAAKAQGRVT